MSPGRDEKRTRSCLIENDLLNVCPTVANKLQDGGGVRARPQLLHVDLQSIDDSSGARPCFFKAGLGLIRAIRASQRALSAP